MINLLPPDQKSGYRYAKRNVTLRKWVVVSLITLIGLGAISTYGLLSLQQSTADYNNRITDSEALFKKEDFQGSQKELRDISGSFKLVIKVLSQEVLFSELIKQIGAAIPVNANLTGLNISQTQGAIDISANATDYSTATQVQVNLSDPANKIFSKADIDSITCGGQNLTNIKFPCTVNIRALFAKNNPFLFINNKAAQP